MARQQIRLAAHVEEVSTTKIREPQQPVQCPSNRVRGGVHGAGAFRAVRKWTSKVKAQYA